MATSLITEIPIFVFSSQIGDIELSTDQEKLVITLEAGTEEIYRSTFYAYDGVVTILKIRDVIEDYMKRKDLSFCAFTMYYNTADVSNLGSFNLNTLYCSVVIGAEAGIFGSYNFLTTLTAKRVPPHTIDTLSFLHGQENGSLLFHCVYETESGEIGNKTFTLKTIATDDIGVSSIQVSYDTIYLRLRLQAGKVSKVLSYTIEFNNRYFTYYVVDNTPNVVFTFKNCFNVYEEIYLNAVTTTKTEVNRSMAISQGRHSFYDQSVDKTYEVETAPMTQAEAEWVEQLFMSHSVRLGTATDPDTLPEVIITNSTCEIDDNDEKLHKVKFTWQFVEHRPHLQTSARTDEQRIFTEPYNHTFN